MPLKESLAEMVGARKQRDEVITKEAAVFTELKESRFNQLKKREKLLVKQAEVELIPLLNNLNEVCYEGKGKIIVTPLSEEDASRRKSYEPFIYGWGKVKAEIKIELHRPGDDRTSCFLKIWEMEKEGKQELIVYFPEVKARLETYSYFFGLIRAQTIIEGDDWKTFNLEESGTLSKVKEYLLEMSAQSHFFPLISNP